MGCDAVLWMWAVCGGMKERKNNSFFLTKGVERRWGASMMQHVANIHPTLAKAAKKRLKKLHLKKMSQSVLNEETRFHSIDDSKF